MSHNTIAIPAIPQQRTEIETGKDAAAKRRELLSQFHGDVMQRKAGYAYLVMAVIDGQDWKYAGDADAKSMEDYLAKYAKPDDMKMVSKEARIELVTNMLRARPDLSLKGIAVVTGTAKPEDAKSGKSLGTASRDRKAALAVIQAERIETRTAELPPAPEKPADDATKEDKQAYKDALALRDKLAKTAAEKVTLDTQKEYRKSQPPKTDPDPILASINVQAAFTPKDGTRKSAYTDEIKSQAKKAAMDAVREVLKSHGLIA